MNPECTCWQKAVNGDISCPYHNELEQEAMSGLKTPTLHDDLVYRAEKWLAGINCKVVIRDPFRCANRENPDAIGWRSDVSILIECKASRSDFHADKKKHFRTQPNAGMGDWRFYMCPPEVIEIEDLPEGWGLLWCYDKKVKRLAGGPQGNMWNTSMPFSGHKHCENTMLVSALRRLSLRGHLGEIYNQDY